jgi:energy-converting hydrogenase Eha subunit C
MHTSHVISDVILALTGFFVFFKYLKPLDFFDTILWESFVLSVAAAAVIGAIGFAGIQDIGWVGVFFQNIATIVGALSIVVASWFLVTDKPINKNIAIGVLAIGFILLVLKLTLNIAPISVFTSIGAMLLVAIIAIYGIVNGNKKAAIWLLAAVILATLANFRDNFITESALAVDAYHYLLAASLLCFGLATTQRKTIA